MCLFLDVSLILSYGWLQATVGFTLFGKETLVEIDINELVPEIQS